MDLQDARVNSEICAACDRIFTKAEKVRYVPIGPRGEDTRGIGEPRTLKEEECRVPHCDSFAAFVKSAQEGCKLCRLFLVQISSPLREWCEGFPGQGYVSVLASFDKEFSSFDLPLRFHLRDGEKELGYVKNMKLQMRIAMTALDTDAEAKLLFCPKDELETEHGDGAGGMVSWEAAMLRWLQFCSSSHSCLDVGKFRSNAPACRLIEVGIAEDLGDIRLIDVGATVSMDSVRYITVSHRWNSKTESCKLIQENFSSRLHGIDWHMLPQSFKDCIQVTRAVQREHGPTFLWIDSLCIIQDSEDDWNVQAALMADIYQGSYCNLVLCGAFDMSIFPSVPRSLTQPVLVKTTSTVFAGTTFEVGNFHPNETIVNGSTIAGRGWIFQELMLAPRAIFFSHQQLFWECLHSSFAQHNPQQEASTRIRSGELQRWLLPDLPSLPTTDRGDDPHRRWWAIVNEYSQRSVTKREDKLVAIAAVAKRFAERLGDSKMYVCGLWRARLPFHLAWHVKSNPPPYEQSSIYSAPSWSWASIDHPSYNQYPNDEAFEASSTQVEVISCPVKTAGDDTFGRVEGGILQVRGRVLRATLMIKTKNSGNLFWDDKRLGRGPQDVELDHSWKTMKTTCFLLPLIEAPWISEQAIKQATALAGLPYVPFGDDCVDPTAIRPVLVGLVLVSTGTKDLFKRLGLFTLEKDFTPFRKCMTDQQGDLVEGDEHLSHRFNGLSTISIV